MKLGIASPQRTMINIMREPKRPVIRTPANRLRDVRSAIHARRLRALLESLSRLGFDK